MPKLNPRARLLIGIKPPNITSVGKGDLDINNAIVIAYPLTIYFDVQKDTSINLNQAHIRLVGLSESTQQVIQQDVFNIVDSKDPYVIRENYFKQTSISSYKRVVLEVGYDNWYSTIFVGNIIEAGTYKEQNSPDIITYIRATDGGYSRSNSVSSFTARANTTSKELLQNLTNDLEGVTIGKIGDLPGTLKRGGTFAGNTFGLINKYFGDTVFIDNQKLFALKPNEVIAGEVPVFDSDSGLLTTPVLKDKSLVVDVLLEPRVVLGQIVEIRSKINPKFNGQYKVDGIKHKGVISGAVNGERITTLLLFRGFEKLGDLNTIK